MSRGAWLVFGACGAILFPFGAFAQAAPGPTPTPPTTGSTASPTITVSPKVNARGVAIALVGAPTEDAIARCESVARAAYARPELTPSIAEDVAGALCGREIDAAATPAARATRDLRAALAAPFDGVAQQALLTALTNEVGVRGVVLVEASAASTALSLLHRVDAPTGSAISLAIDPMRFELPFVTAATTSAEAPDDAAVFAPSAQAMQELLAAPPCERSSANRSPLSSCPGAAAVSEPPREFAWWTYEEPKQGGASLVDSPWFWIAAGGVGALGLTVLIVSQTTDVNVGTVHIDGSVPK